MFYILMHQQVLEQQGVLASLPSLLESFYHESCTISDCFFQHILFPKSSHIGARLRNVRVKNLHFELFNVLAVPIKARSPKLWVANRFQDLDCTGVLTPTLTQHRIRIGTGQRSVPDAVPVPDTVPDADKG